MSSQGKKWIVRDGKGHIFGPFDQAKIQELLRSGMLSGEEEAAHYPAGDWGPMSADRDLYDLVLESLAAPVERKPPQRGKPAVDEKSETKKQKDDTAKSKTTNEASIGTFESNPAGFEEPATVIQKNKGHKGGSKPKGGQTGGPIPLHNVRGYTVTEKSQRRPDIELSDKTELKKKTRVQRNFLPFLLLLAAGFLFYMGTNYKGSIHRKNPGVSLLVPHPSTKPNNSKADALVRKGWAYFYKDTYSAYINAEGYFVEAVEASSQSPEALLMLLQTDYQLWPFAKQDSQDQNTVQSLVQMISQADRLGNKRAIGAATMDMILGNDTSARTQIDSTLAAEPAEGRLYQMKGQLLFDSSDFQGAAGYFEKAATLLPYWVRPFYMLGLSFSRQSNGAEAQKYLLQALKMNPGHAAARLELGIVEARFFNNEERGKGYLTTALNGDEKLAPAVEARGRYWLGLILEKHDDRIAAKYQAQLAFDLSPSDPDIRELLGRLGGKVPPEGGGNDREHMAMGDQYMRLNNFLGAQAQFKAAFQANPKNARAAMKAAEALWRFHQSGEAMEYLQKSIMADPKFIESYVLLADYKSRRFDFDGATKNLESALKVNSKSYAVYRGFGDLLYRRGDLTAAEAYVTRALGLYEIDVKTNVLMAKIQLGKKNLVKAIQYSKRAVELDKGDVDAQVNYAKVLGAYEGVPAGVAYLTDLINTYPTQLGFRLGLAEILVQDEQYANALTLLAQITAADDKNQEAYLLMGDASSLNSDLDGATSNYIAAARVDPSEPTPLFRLGEVYLKANKPDKAAEQFQLVLRVNPMYPRTHYNMARALFQSQLPDKAIEECEVEKKLNPKLADPYEFEGDLYLVTRNFTRAAREYQRASEIKDQGAGIYVKMARAYRGQGSYDEAAAMLKMAAAKESGNSEIYKEYGYLYDAKGMQAEATTSFQQYLRLEPNSPDKQQILDKINSY